jgi:hypothetical protein
VIDEKIPEKNNNQIDYVNDMNNDKVIPEN